MTFYSIIKIIKLGGILEKALDHFLLLVRNKKTVQKQLLSYFSVTNIEEHHKWTALYGSWGYKRKNVEKFQGMYKKKKLIVVRRGQQKQYISLSKEKIYKTISLSTKNNNRRLLYLTIIYGEPINRVNNG